MRPVRLEVEGFTAFRGPTTVDFGDIELFALVGPTGAGKTSVIDALTFALYGSIPRLDDRRAVAPVISQNLNEARVRLDFTIDGVPHTAVRVVRATKSGATTKEARLERRGEVLAGTADEVTNVVTELLGLTFEHFITCVSLPQGQFARFLHDKPRSRQDLLVRLLDLGLYDAVASAARHRGALARNRADVVNGQLGRLAGATPEARAEAAERVRLLTALGERLQFEKPMLDELLTRAVEADEKADALADQSALLASLAAPAGVDELAAALVEADDARRQAAELDDEAAATVSAAEERLASLPERSLLDALLTDHGRRDELVTSVARGEGAEATAAERSAEAAEREGAAREAEAEHRAVLERIRVELRAQALVPELVVGEPCPVCRQDVVTLPGGHHPPDLAAAEQALSAASAALATATRDLTDARTHQARVEAKLATIRSELTEVEARLESRSVALHPFLTPTSLAPTAAATAITDGAIDPVADGAIDPAASAAVDLATHGPGALGSPADETRANGRRSSAPVTAVPGPADHVDGASDTAGAAAATPDTDEHGDAAAEHPGRRRDAAAATDEAAGADAGAERRSSGRRRVAVASAIDQPMLFLPGLGDDGAGEASDADDSAPAVAVTDEAAAGVSLGAPPAPAPADVVVEPAVGTAEVLVAAVAPAPGAQVDGDATAQPPRRWVEAKVVEQQLVLVVDAEEALAKARLAERDARRVRSDAERRHAGLLNAERDARRQFDGARDTVASLGPPAAERRDLAADWRDLLAWAAERQPDLDAESDGHRQAAATARAEATTQLGRVVTACHEAGVDAASVGGWPGEAVAAARARADEAVHAIDGQIAEAEGLRAEAHAATEDQRVADTLAGHLAANRFEKWLLDEAVHQLVAGATELLAELTGGGYALDVDRRTGGFLVIDHTNASQPRPARTLSGGETFLASLALALALADQVAGLAAGGAARLEALFLDEGFGTLDAETLDVVAAALDELGARGRMVGVVTHVRELAERLPVRFEVRKVGGAATVSRVDA